MEVRIGKKDKNVTLPGQVAGVAKRLSLKQNVWQERLRQDPSRFGEVEAAMHHDFQQMADQVAAGLLADVGARPRCGAT